MLPYCSRLGQPKVDLKKALIFRNSDIPYFKCLQYFCFAVIVGGNVQNMISVKIAQVSYVVHL